MYIFFYRNDSFRRFFWASGWSWEAHEAVCLVASFSNAVIFLKPSDFHQETFYISYLSRPTLPRASPFFPGKELLQSGRHIQPAFVQLLFHLSTAKKNPAKIFPPPREYFFFFFLKKVITDFKQGISWGRGGQRGASVGAGCTAVQRVIQGEESCWALLN